MSVESGPDGRRPSRSRLSRSAEFDRVFRQGRSHGNRALVLYAFPRGDGEPVRCGLSVSRKVGGAVERNRVKRLLREALRREADSLPPGVDVVVLARPDARELAEREGLEGVHRALRELIDRAGGGAADADGGAADGGAAGASAAGASVAGGGPDAAGRSAVVGIAPVAGPEAPELEPQPR